MVIMVGYEKRFLSRPFFFIIKKHKNEGTKEVVSVCERYMMPKSALLQFLHTEADSH